MNQTIQPGKTYRKPKANSIPSFKVVLLQFVVITFLTSLSLYLSLSLLLILSHNLNFHLVPNQYLRHFRAVARALLTPFTRLKFKIEKHKSVLARVPNSRRLARALGSISTEGAALSLSHSRVNKINWLSLRGAFE